MAEQITADIVLRALGRVHDPEIRKPITDLGMIEDLNLTAGRVALTLKLTIAGRVIVIEKDGETVSAGDPFTNTKIRADITLTKVDKAGKPLAGAKFALRDKDGKTVQEAVSAANGLVVFERVAYGTYTVVETAAPAGYKLTDKAIEVKVAVEGQTVDAGKIINERTPAVALSVTGTDISLAALAGGAALVLGVILLGVRRRKQSA